MRKGHYGEEKNGNIIIIVIIIMFIVVTKIVASRPHECRPTGTPHTCAKMFQLPSRGRIQAVSWERCTFPNISNILDYASKNSKEFHIFFKFGRNIDAQI